MRKSLTLAMALALGVTASAYAANPFSDVPAGHWAYDSVKQLAADGVVEGFANGEFGGDKLLTRYEMAQIVAKAMAKGASCDKLAAEFAVELDSLGVRVAKLEKDSDAVKITGEVRYHYGDYKLKYSDGNWHDYENALRSRIWIQGAINDDWTYTGMVQNVQDFTNNAGEEDTKFKRAYVEGKIGGVDVLAGRYNAYLVNGNLYDEHADGIELSYGKDVKVTAFYMKPTDQNSYYAAAYEDYDYDYDDDGIFGEHLGYWNLEYGKAYGVKVDTKIGIVNATVGYTVFRDGANNYYALDTERVEWTYPQADNKIWNVGISLDIAKDLTFYTDYMKSNMNVIYDEDKEDVVFDGDDGIVIGFNYKGAIVSKPGSYGLYAKYYDQAKGTVLAHTMNGYYGAWGFKGYMIGANYTLAKNVVASLEWYDLDEKSAAMNNDDSLSTYAGYDNMRTLWAQVVYTF